jgi:hypothetical protein
MEFSDFKKQFPHSGTLKWIGARPDRKGEILVLEDAFLSEEKGLEKDH